MLTVFVNPVGLFFLVPESSSDQPFASGITNNSFQPLIDSSSRGLLFLSQEDISQRLQTPPRPLYRTYWQEGDRFLMCSKKRPNNATSNYLVSMRAGDLDRNSRNFLGKLRANFVGTEFQVGFLK